MSHSSHIPVMVEFTPQSDVMRQQQTVFKGADGDILRTGNKHGLGLCEHCRKKAPKGKRFRRCTGCMTAMYCGETCQRAAWPVHKQACQFHKKNLQPAFDPNVSDEERRQNARRMAALALLRDFLEAHRLSLNHFVNARVLFEGGSEGLFAKGGVPVLSLPLYYSEYARPLLETAMMDIDPARAFRLGRPEFMTLEELVAQNPNFQDLWDSSAGLREVLHEEEAGNTSFVGLMMVVFQGMDDMVLKSEIYPMRRTFGDPETTVPPCEDCKKLEIDYALKRMNWGLVYRPDPAKRDKCVVPGYLKKDGTVWRWTKLYDDLEKDMEFLLTPPGQRMELLGRKLIAARIVV